MLDDVPAAAGPAHLRPDAARAGRQRALPAVRRLREELLRLQPARRLPRRPQRRRPRTGAATGATSSARSRASCSRFFEVPEAARTRRRSSGGMALYMAVSVAVVRAARRVRQGEHAHDHEALRRRSRFSIFYWYEVAAPAIVRPDRARRWAVRAARDRARRHLVRAHATRKEEPFLEQRAAPRRARRRSPTAAPRSIARRHRGVARRRARGHVRAGGQARRRRSPGMSLLEIAEANGLAIEAGCRMGICGADPVAIKDGMELHVGDLRRRAGDARAPRPAPRTRAWRAACASAAR